MVLSKLDISSVAFENEEDCQIEATIACYEAIQFSYFNNNEKNEKKDWMEIGGG